MLRLLGWFLLLVAACSCVASRYTHQLLLVGDGDYGGGGFLNQSGEAFYIAGVDQMYALFANSTRVTDWHNGNYAPMPRGINGRGDLLWERTTWNSEYQTYVSHVMLNSYNLSDNTGGVSWISAGAVGINENGQVAWGGTPDYDDFPHVSFVGDVNYNVKYDVYSSVARALNNSGQLLWEHSAGTDGHPGLFVDGDEISVGLLSGTATGLQGIALNDHSDALWWGYQSSWGTSHAFLNQTDLTMKFLGQNVYSLPVALNSRSQVLWEYQVKIGSLHYWNVMVDGVDLTSAVHPGLDSVGVALNNRGDVLWQASNPLTSKVTDVVVNNYDLIPDLLGSGVSVDGATAFDINDSGQVLWSVARNGHTYYYLSTPVPEPSVLLLGLPVVALVLRRRR